MCRPYVYRACFVCYTCAATAHQSGSGVSGRQLKEKLFLQEVQQTASEETANQLRWSVGGGAAVM